MDRGVETSGSERQHGLESFPAYRDLLHHLIDGHAILEVLEDDRDRVEPCCAD
jgi:hypothetical protein